MSTQQQRSGYKIGGDIGNVGQLRDRATGFAMLLALSVMVFMRRKVGLRKLGKGVLVAMTALMLIVSWFNNLHFSLLGGFSSGDDESLAYFAIAALCVGLWQRRKRKQEIKCGEAEHTFSHGDTWFNFLPIREDFILRFVDPAVTFIVGGLLHYRLGLGVLGLWVMAAAVAFAIVEQAVHSKREDQFLNDLDTHYEAKMRARVMTHLIGRDEMPMRNADETGASISTGADAQLAAQIAKRRQEMARTEAGDDGTGIS